MMADTAVRARGTPQFSMAPPRPAELAIIVPTFNERGNLEPLVDRLARQLGDVVWEAIVVDDESPDGTAAFVRDLGRRDARVRCLQRIGRRGLSSACIEGMLATNAPYVAVIDADLQHDEALLPRMLEVLRAGEADLAVGSRYALTSAVPGWDSRRHLISRFATRVGRAMLRIDLSDPMSGFFMIRRAAFEGVLRRLSGVGFKLLLDLLASEPSLRVRELPYRFRQRQIGESKLDARAAIDFLLMLLDKLVGRVAPPRLVLFSMVGTLGILVHLAVVELAFGLGQTFVVGQASATVAAMTSNFAINNELTYRDRRLRGSRWLRGWLSFAAVCGIGALANVGVAARLYADATPWPLSALAGIAVGTVWNYVVTARYVWRS
jgi:dolichol-phosphate mannosyltransferase